MKKLEILSSLPFYQKAPQHLQRKMEKIAIYSSVSPGVLFFVEGDNCSNVGFLGAGKIRVSKAGETGREINLYHVEAGEGCVLNLSCAFASLKYPATATVEEPTEMVIFPVSEFQQWLNQDEVRTYIFNLFSLRFARVITLIDEIIFRKMDQRLASFLLTRFDNIGRPRRSISITQEQIAAELGTAREVVNRLLKEFERNGAITSTRGTIRLQNESRLKEFVSSQ